MSKIKDLNEMENLKLNIIWATSKEKNCKFYKYYFYSFKIVVTSPKQQQKIDLYHFLSNLIVYPTFKVCLIQLFLENLITRYLNI